MCPAPSDWVGIATASSAVFSRDGARLFHLRGGGGAHGLAQVWVMDRDGGNAIQLSDHQDPVRLLRRSPADDRLVWAVDQGGDERHQLWTLAPGGTPAALTASPEVIHDFGAFAPDGTSIALAANDRDESGMDLLLLDVATGARRRLAESVGQWSVAAWSPAGTPARLAVLHDYATSDQRLWILDVADGAAHEVPRSGLVRYQATRWTADGAALMTITDAGGADFLRLCRLDPVGGGIEEVYAAPGREVEAWALSPDGALLATVENDRGYGVLFVGPVGGARRQVTGLPAGVVGDLAWAPDGSALAFTAQGPAAPPGIWLWTPATGRAAPVYQPAAPDGTVAWKLVEWTSFDGRRIPGWFATPDRAAPPAGFPAVVWVHGGPASQTRANWRPDIQMLLDQGFAVLLPNIRGSTGYGRAYMEADEVGLRPDCLRDLEAGRTWLLAQPGIDRNRIGIMGQSYGGWVVLAAIGMQPELWRAAIDYYGIADFATLLERTGPWRRDHRAREYGFPGTDDALFDVISPIRHVDRVTAPLLVLHGDRDPRVPMHESDQYVQAMELRQKRVTYERFEYAGHGFLRADHRRRVYDAVAAHFIAHLAGEG